MDVHSNVEDFLSYDYMEGGDGVSLEWLSTFVEDCLNGGGLTTQPVPTPTNTQTPSPIQAQSPKPISKARTKRRKTHHNRFTTDPPLVPQTHWLADSELLFPKKETSTTTVKVKVEEEEEEEEERLGKDDCNGGELVVVGPRRCTHCLSQKTPQWRAGPLGPKTLCNACGVRFKSGRLVPEYRPAKSPTFESSKHSNSHKKVMEMRMGMSIKH